MPSSSVCLAITRLRVGVIVCAWIVGLALAAQTLIWSMGTFTQVRFNFPAEQAAEAPLIVTGEPQSASQGRILPPAADANGAAKDAGPPITLSSTDRLFHVTSDLATGAGRLALLAMLLMMALGVMLAAASAVPGVERTVSSFMWVLPVALLVLPLGRVMDLPWEDGALTSYAQIMTAVDEREVARNTGDDARAAWEAGMAARPIDPQGAMTSESGLVFFTRFLLAPIACIVGLVLVGLRFCAGVEAAVLQQESFKLDPTLEREAANVKPSSLHGGRAAGILDRTIGSSTGESAPASPAPTPAPAVMSGGGSAAPDSPRRLI